MFNLGFIHIHTGLIQYWHNGFVHFLDSENSVIKIPCKKLERSLKIDVHANSITPQEVYLCRAVDNCAYYQDVFLKNIKIADKSFTVDIVDKDGEVKGKLEVTNKSKTPLECCHTMTEHWDFVYFTI